MFSAKKYVTSIINEERSFIGYLGTIGEDSFPRVTPLSFLTTGNGKLYFMTDQAFAHSKNAERRGYVGVAESNGLSTVGAITSLGHTGNPELHYLVEAFKKHYPSNWDKYGSLPNQVFFEIVPTEVRFWRYVDGVPYKGSYSYQSGEETLEKYEIIK